MIVCLCHGVPERVVDETIAEGASTVLEIGAACGAGTACGACKCTLEQKLACRAPKGGASAAVRLPLDAISPTG